MQISKVKDDEVGERFPALGRAANRRFAPLDSDLVLTHPGLRVGFELEDAKDAMSGSADLGVPLA